MSPAANPLEQLLAQQSEWLALVERLQGPERSAMRFMCESYRALGEMGSHERVHDLLAQGGRFDDLCQQLRAYTNVGLVGSGSLNPAVYDLLLYLPSSATDLLARDYDVSLKVVADWLDTSTKTMARRGKLTLLSRTESDVALRYGRVFEQAKEAFGTEEAARQWLTEAQPSLGHAVPVDLLKSDLGARQVERVLRLIDYGDYI